MEMHHLTVNHPHTWCTSRSILVHQRRSGYRVTVHIRTYIEALQTRTCQPLLFTSRVYPSNFSYTKSRMRNRALPPPFPLKDSSLPPSTITSSPLANPIESTFSGKPLPECRLPSATITKYRPGKGGVRVDPREAKLVKMTGYDAWRLN